MDEEKTTKEVKKEEPTNDKDEGSERETAPIIERAREEREKLEAAIEKKEKLLDREDAMIAKRTLGGQSEAGSSPEKPKEETPSEYKDKIMRGEA